MKISFNKKITALVILLTLITITAVKASTPYSVSIKSKDTNEYPRVVLEMSVSGKEDIYYARDFQILENGERNIGPMIFLAPSTAKSSVELRVLLDNSGNTKKYETVIKSNIKALAKYIDSQVSVFKLIIDTFGGSETSISIDNTDKLYLIDEINFSNTPITAEYNFYKINELVTGSPVGPEKIALIINGGRFHVESDRSDINSAISDLASKGYKTFACGYPTSSLYPFQPENMFAEDMSIFRDVHGGFIGTFNTDLSVIYELIKKTYEGNYVMHYYTNNLPEAGGSSQIYINDYNVATISLPASGSAEPEITSGLSEDIDKQGVLPINIRINPKSKMINGVVMKFFNGEQSVFQGLLRERNDEGADNLYTGEINIPASIINSSVEDEYTGKYVRYYLNAYTPYNVLSTEDLPMSVPILLYDEDISFYSQNINNGEQVIWNWDKEGAKVFEVWQGNTKIRSKSSEKKIILDADECGKYSIIKVRASDVSNPTANDWGYFSKPMEVYLDDDGIITEQQALNIMMGCIDSDKKEISSISSLINGDENYSPDSILTTEKMFYYITGIVNNDVKSEMSGQVYSLLYYIMNFINSSEYDTYKDGTVKKSVLYKVITNTNQIADLKGRFDLAMHELSIRLLGSSAI